MEKFESVRLDDDYKKSLDSIMSDSIDLKEQTLLAVNPPKTGGGINIAKNLYKSLYSYKTASKGFTGDGENVSETMGFEIWYDGTSMEFVYYCPTDEIQEALREQLHARYECSVQTKFDKFVSINPDEDIQKKSPTKTDETYVAGCELILNNHFFEKIQDSGFDENPYKPILGDVDTKDGTRKLIQVLFKPSERNWATASGFYDIRDRIDSLKEGRVERKYMGLSQRKVDPDPGVKNYANRLESQINKRSYYVSLRFVIIGEDKTKVETQAQKLANHYQIEYETPSNQRFRPIRNKREETIKQVLEDMVKREGYKMKNATSTWTQIKTLMSPNSEMIVMTLPELAALAFLPDSSAVDLSGIRWSQVSFHGSLPPEASQFEPLSKEDKFEKLREMKESREAAEKYIEGEIDSIEEGEEIEGEADDDDDEDALSV